MLHFINFYILQWLFLRLGTEKKPGIVHKFDMYEASIMMDGSVGIGGKVQDYEPPKQRFILIIGAYPMSGYDDYSGDTLVKSRPWKYIAWTKTIYLSPWRDKK